MKPACTNSLKLLLTRNRGRPVLSATSSGVAGSVAAVNRLLPELVKCPSGLMHGNYVFS